jgi:hypothetical protein
VERGDFPDKANCSKGGGLLCKDWSRDVVVEGMITHLVESPYHKFDRDEAIEVAEHTLVEEEHWTQHEYDKHMSSQVTKREEPSRDAPRRDEPRREEPRRGDVKRCRPSSPPPYTLVRREPVHQKRHRHADGNGSNSTGNTDSNSGGADASSTRGGVVELRMGELQIVLGGIKRAMMSARNAETICDSAAANFRAEANALEAAHGHFTQLAMFQ